jgi:hypothetical protein
MVGWRARLYYSLQLAHVAFDTATRQEEEVLEALARLNTVRVLPDIVCRGGT